jgi:glycogen debranching enzyme
LEPDVEVVLPDLPLHCKKSQVAKETLAYLAGYIAKTLLKKHGTCTTCRELLLRTHGDVPIEVIEARNFNQNRFLTQPGSFLYYVTSEACTRLVYLISRYCKYETIHKILESILVKFENFTPSNCIEHNDLPKFFIFNQTCTQ